ncbi:inner centromere protein-like isoform X12 [Vespula squamosa]|uniref:Inner centromere protein-like isoform X12 n=1 Tax=Vespula squamosa TaxID=30214 RepID=A0ABD2A9L8_VESSQ
MGLRCLFVRIADDVRSEIRVSGLERSLAEDEEGDASTEAGRELKREVEVEVGASSDCERLSRMLTARSGPLGVPRSLGPLEGSDHLFLLPERALIMDSSRLRQDLAGLDFNLRFNILQTAPRGNVWLLRLGRRKEEKEKGKNLTEFHFDKEALSYEIS